MHRFFVSPEGIGKTHIRITGGDVNHIRNVLRMQEGDEIRVGTGEDDRDFRCQITRIDPQEVEALILWVEHTQAELPGKLILFQGLPKSDKMEWVIQKAVELGVSQVVPVAMQRSVMKLTQGKAQSKVRRWNAIAESAAKQSKRGRIPQVSAPLSFPEAVSYAKSLDTLLFPYELARDMEHTRAVLSALVPGQSIGIFIGPEGGFAPGEADALEAAGASVITLGRRILRTETAGMVVLSMLNLLLEDRKA